MNSQQFEIGLSLCERLHGAHSGAAIVEALGSICPDYITMNMEWAYAGVTGRQGLPIETRCLLLLASCICRGELPAQVKAYTEAALGLGISREQVIETILQTLPIAGYPAVTNALLCAKDVLNNQESSDATRVL